MRPHPQPLSREERGVRALANGTLSGYLQAAQVVSGIGFLGAGTILLRKNAIRGLTTAASVWAVAGIGLAAGAGLFGAAIATTEILLTILVGAHCRAVAAAIQCSSHLVLG